MKVRILNAHGATFAEFSALGKDMSVQIDADHPAESLIKWSEEQEETSRRLQLNAQLARLAAYELARGDA